MTKTVDVYFDYVCPYCYVAFKRENLLRVEFDVEFDWRPWEIHPERVIPPMERLSLAPPYIIGNLSREINAEITLPKHRSNSHLALLGTEVAKKMGKFRQYHNKIWQVHWEDKKDISDIKVLRGICTSIGVDPAVFEQKIADPQFEAILEKNDKEAERIGVERVPSYILGKRIVVGDIRLPNLKRALSDFLQR